MKKPVICCMDAVLDPRFCLTELWKVSSGSLTLRHSASKLNNPERESIVFATLREGLNVWQLCFKNLSRRRFADNQLVTHLFEWKKSHTCISGSLIQACSKTVNLSCSSGKSKGPEIGEECLFAAFEYHFLNLLWSGIFPNQNALLICLVIRCQRSGFPRKRRWMRKKTKNK